MKYVITIIATTTVFAILGLLAACGVVANDRAGHTDTPLMAFTIMPLAGAGVGLITACIAAGLGYCFSRQDVGKAPAA
jgi:hypothetical protein